MKQLIYLSILCFAFFSCKKSKNYKCQANCTTLTVNGKITNETDFSMAGVANQRFSFSLKKTSRGLREYNMLGTAETNSQGEFTFSITIDSTILSENKYYFNINYEKDPDSNFAYHYITDNRTYKFPSNGKIDYKMKALELTSVELDLVRTMNDTFKNCQFSYNWANYIIKNDKSNFVYAESNSPKKFIFKIVSNNYFHYSLLKHSGIFDTIPIPGTPGLKIIEVGNILIKDSIYCMPKINNYKILNY